MSYAVIIAGTRTMDATDAEIEELVEELPHFPDIVFSGACPRGIDQCGERWAKNRSVPLKRFPALWNNGIQGSWDRNAGNNRNQQMADEADALILIWNGKSKGSANMKKHAASKNLLIIEKVKL